MLRISSHPILGDLNRRIRAGDPPSMAEFPKAALITFGTTRDQLLSRYSPVNDHDSWDELVSSYESEMQADDAGRIRLFFGWGIDPCDENGLMPIVDYFGVLIEALCRNRLGWVPCRHLEQFRRARQPVADNDTVGADNDDQSNPWYSIVYGMDN